MAILESRILWRSASRWSCGSSVLSSSLSCLSMCRQWVTTNRFVFCVLRPLFSLLLLISLSLSLSLSPSSSLSHTSSSIQGFYHLCLDTTSWNKSGTTGTCISDSIGLANDSNPDIISCSNYVCAGSLPSSNQSYIDCCTSRCFQPYTFVCQLPLQILWYIIYWLFFALSWWVANE